MLNHNDHLSEIMEELDHYGICQQTDYYAQVDPLQSRTDSQEINRKKNRPSITRHTD